MASVKELGHIFIHLIFVWGGGKVEVLGKSMRMNAWLGCEPGVIYGSTVCNLMKTSFSSSFYGFINE